MQIDPSRDGVKSLASRIGPPLKRPFGQAATALKSDAEASPRSMKQPKLDKDASSTSREASGSGKPAAKTASMPSRAKAPPSSSRSGGRSSRSGRGGDGRSRQAAGKASQLVLPEPLMDEAFVESTYGNVALSSSKLAADWKSNPKSALANFMMQTYKTLPKYVVEEGVVSNKRVTR